MTPDPILLVLLAAAVATGIVVAAVPRWRKPALALLGALGTLVLARGGDLLLRRPKTGPRLPPKPDKKAEAAAAEQEREAVDSVTEALARDTPPRVEPVDLGELERLANRRMAGRKD